MRERTRDQDDIARAVAEDAVGDMNVAALGVSGWSFHGYPPISASGMSSLAPSLVLAY